MAKGSVRKKGKKWYYRYYVEGEDGRLVQKECVGTESKSETEALLRKAIDDYEQMQFVARPENHTLADLLDLWVEEELKPGSLSSGTVNTYQTVVGRIKTYPIANRKLKTITPEHLQAFVDLLYTGGVNADGSVQQPLSKDYRRLFSSVLSDSFRYAVFPKRLITFNPMQYVVFRRKNGEADLFADEEEQKKPTISHETFLKLTAYLEEKKNPALLPVQIAYYSGLRIGEVCGLVWKDIDLEEKTITVRRSIRENDIRKKKEIGTTKRNKIRVVDICDTLADILRKAKKRQEENARAYAELYRKNYCKEVVEKGRVYYELYTVPASEDIPEGCRVIDFVCRRDDGSIEMPSTIQTMCVKLRKKFPELEGFHFHILRHSFSSNLLGNGVDPKAVQELMGHSDVSTTMNIYGHASREAKKNAGHVMDSIGNPGKRNLSLVSPDEGKNKGKETSKKRKMA